MNEQNYKKILDKIESCPTQWNQKAWHCGTSHCFAGWAQILSGRPADDNTVRRDARIFLDLSFPQANYLFSGDRKIADFKSFLELGAGFDRAGFDRAGFDRAGFDRAGFDRAGFDRAGFDRAGFDRDGIDRDGFDSDGIDRAGFDRAGFDSDGLDENNQPQP